MILSMEFPNLTSTTNSKEWVSIPITCKEWLKNSEGSDLTKKSSYLDSMKLIYLVKTFWKKKIEKRKKFKICISIHNPIWWLKTTKLKNTPETSSNTKNIKVMRKPDKDLNKDIFLEIFSDLKKTVFNSKWMICLVKMLDQLNLKKAGKDRHELWIEIKESL